MSLDAERLQRLKEALRHHYRIGRELGTGGMATVYLADEQRHARQVAFKVLHPHLAATLGTDRFLREIMLTANLTHPHILPLFDSGAVDGYLYYTMPYVEGETLRGLLRREVQLPIGEALRITKEIADALGFAHARKVVHRDIKPENILLEAGHAVVSDFGIAKAVREASSEDLTATGMALGTPEYMSPEQAAGSTHIDGRSDIYSLACVLYEMLAGDPPFTGSVREAILARKALDPVLPIHRIRDTVPPALDAVLAQALAKVPADRYRTMEEFVEALNAPRSHPHVAPSAIGHEPVPQGQEDFETSMPLMIKPLLEELDVFGVTYPGKLSHQHRDHFLICSLGRYVNVHQTSLPDATPLPRIGERQAFLAMIADGIGRGPWALEASRGALEVLAHYMAHSVRCYNIFDESHDQAIVESIREAATQCQAHIAQKARENPDGRGMSAGISMWVGCWPRAYVLQVGSTRCYRLRDGTLAQVTTDDVGDHVFGQRSSLAQISDPTSSIVFRLGNSWGTVILLCTDELTKYVADSQIRDRLSNITSAQQTCQDLWHDAVAAGATDSLTMIIGRARPVMRTRR
jgi:serine/threonine protein kinase